MHSIIPLLAHPIIQKGNLLTCRIFSYIEYFILVSLSIVKCGTVGCGWLNGISVVFRLIISCSYVYF